jgi:glutamyl-tRNA reductase
MEILCYGLSHHTAPVEVRERYAIADGRLAKTALELAAEPGLHEAVVVATCNRVEFYVAAENATQAFESLDRYIATHLAEPDGFVRHAAPRSIRHLFRVVCGLESMVLGETEIFGQVKKAYQTAHAAGATARHLNKLFQRAFNVAKEIRTRTNITRGAVSVGSVAVDLAEKIFGRLGDCKVMILGAGETGEMTAGALQARGVKTIFVSNRSYERAALLAEKMGGRAVHFDEWPREICDVDILIGSTAAPHHVLTADQLAPLMRHRTDRPLFCIDLAVPRDIDPAVNELEGVYLYDIDSLQAIADHSMAIRRQEIAVCEEMIERHVADITERLGAEPKPPGWHAAQPQGG